MQLWQVRVGITLVLAIRGFIVPFAVFLVLFLLLSSLVVNVGNPDDANAGDESEELGHDQEKLRKLTLIINSAREHVTNRLKDQWDDDEEHERSAHVRGDHDHPQCTQKQRQNRIVEKFIERENTGPIGPLLLHDEFRPTVLTQIPQLVDE